jgi:hypothetical protein
MVAKVQGFFIAPKGDRFTVHFPGSFVELRNLHKPGFFGIISLIVPMALYFNFHNRDS